MGKVTVYRAGQDGVFRPKKTPGEVLRERLKEGLIVSAGAIAFVGAVGISVASCVVRHQSADAKTNLRQEFRAQQAPQTWVPQITPEQALQEMDARVARSVAEESPRGAAKMAANETIPQLLAR